MRSWLTVGESELTTTTAEASAAATHEMVICVNAATSTYMPMPARRSQYRANGRAVSSLARQHLVGSMYLRASDEIRHTVLKVTQGRVSHKTSL